jgi:WXXGXW repeat (2 copies)
MNKLRVSGMIAVMVAVIMIATGCHKNVSAQNQANDPDPAAANMAPGDDSAAPDAQQAPAGQGTNEAITAAQTAQPTDQQPADQTQQDQGAPADPNAAQGYASADDSGNSVDYDDATAQSDQAPPPLPDYDQPPLPGDGYIWTPGYWAWSPDGYFWVPGAWVMPPYEGALWTPGYWGFNDGRYFFFSGYWGRYIGYYGGINYGFGYIGRGYEGGYWRGNRFQYNNSFNVIRINVGNVYTHPVPAPFARVSFNGPGGAHLRPVRAEFNAMRQPRVAPMSTQLQAQRSAQQNRAQFANVNHGRPATVVAPRPITADTRTQSLPPARSPQQQPQSQLRRGNQMQGPQNQNQQHPAFQPNQQQHPAQQSAPQQARPVPQQPAAQQPRPTPQQFQQQPQRQENPPRPAQQPAPQQQARPVPQQEQPRQFQMQPRPEQQQQFTPPSRPAPEQQRPENFSRPAPQQQARPATPAPAPAPRPAPAPQQQRNDSHGDGHDDHR